MGEVGPCLSKWLMVFPRKWGDLAQLLHNLPEGTWPACEGAGTDAGSPVQSQVNSPQHVAALPPRQSSFPGQSPKWWGWGAVTGPLCVGGSGVCVLALGGGATGQHRP